MRQHLQETGYTNHPSVWVLPQRAFVRLVKYYKGAHPFAQFLGHYGLLSVISVLSPIFPMMQQLLQRYIDLPALTANPALLNLELQRLSEYLILHPTELTELRLGLVLALLAHLLYMLVAWRGTLWLLKRMTQHIQPDPKPFVFCPW